jgi:hypothetical protein
LEVVILLPVPVAPGILRLQSIKQKSKRLMAKKGKPGSVAVGGKQQQRPAAAQTVKQAIKEPVQPPPEDDDFEAGVSDDEENDENDSLPSSGAWVYRMLGQVMQATLKLG